MIHVFTTAVRIVLLTLAVVLAAIAACALLLHIRNMAVGTDYAEYQASAKAAAIYFLAAIISGILFVMVHVGLNEFLDNKED